MTHLGQRLSALIDGELEVGERERVLLHLTKCGSCREEAAALRTLKRRMSALRDAAAGAGLTGRLIELSALASLTDSDAADAAPQAQPYPDRPASPGGSSQASAQQRAGRYFLAGSVAVFLAGLGTAAFIAGGEPQPQAPTPPVTPSVDVLVFGHGPAGNPGTAPPVLRPASLRPQPVVDDAHTSRTGA
ncbi:MAG TPA: zf-HC2 domain-containing protein [Streptosporangiaceae bacterium]|nr:zf-HC2 domain-containing protein [Streptosporangiaceae bacterium]